MPRIWRPPAAPSAAAHPAHAEAQVRARDAEPREALIPAGHGWAESMRPPEHTSEASRRRSSRGSACLGDRKRKVWVVRTSMRPARSGGGGPRPWTVLIRICVYPWYSGKQRRHVWNMHCGRQSCVSRRRGAPRRGQVRGRHRQPRGRVVEQAIRVSAQSGATSCWMVARAARNTMLAARPS